MCLFVYLCIIDCILKIVGIIKVYFIISLKKINMIKINNYSFLKYLNSYDLIHKYNFKSIYLVPKINKINLKILVEQNIVVKLKSQYKVFLFYYLYNFCCSKIILRFFTNLKKKLKTMTLKSQIIIDISRKKIFDFLISIIFLLNTKILKSSFSSSLVSFNFVSGKSQYQYLHLIFPISTSLFSGKINQNQQQINFNDLTVFFSFSVKNSIALLPYNFFLVNNYAVYTNFFKNIFIFWSLKI